MDGEDGMREGKSFLWWMAGMGWDGEESSFRASWWKESRLAKLTISSG